MLQTFQFQEQEKLGWHIQHISAISKWIEEGIT